MKFKNKIVDVPWSSSGVTCPFLSSPDLPSGTRAQLWHCKKFDFNNLDNVVYVVEDGSYIAYQDIQLAKDIVSVEQRQGNEDIYLFDPSGLTTAGEVKDD